MNPSSTAPLGPVVDVLPVDAAAFYRRALEVLTAAELPFLVGGAYALARHAGIVRHTKDLDVFVLPEDCGRALAALAEAGYRTELTFPHWLGKAFDGDHLVDVIFSSGNGLCPVDRAWFDHAPTGDLLGWPVRFCPAEETIWSKAFLQERERFDGADIAHLLRARGRSLDWPRLLRRFGPHWRVLLAHLVLFGFAYPGERDAVPARVLDELTARLRRESHQPPTDERLCRGTLLSREQYLVDVHEWGYTDARLRPDGPMAAEDVAHWTWAIDNVE
jgi:hypothetical protein